MTVDLAERIGTHLDWIVTEAGHRPPGSDANRRATAYAADVLAGAGLRVTRLPFRARYWVPGTARLTVDRAPIPVDPPPFCAAASVTGPVVHAGSDEDLAALEAGPGAVIVLTGPLATPCFPKAFPFLQLPDQQARIARLEQLRPAAVLAVVPDEAAHEPVFEDPDLVFPYATVRASDAAALVAGAAVRLEVEASIREDGGVNVSAGAGHGPRAVACAHVDSKVTTPGAFDNGGGVATLLALAEAGLEGLGEVELVLFNGEDHYAAPGEQAWLGAGGLDGVDLVVNVDGAGLRGHRAAVSTIGATPWLDAAVERALASTTSVVGGEPWFESDHAVFAMHGIPTVAITSDGPWEELRRRSHAPDDRAAAVDPAVLAEVAGVIRSILAARVARSVRAREP